MLASAIGGVQATEQLVFFTLLQLIVTVLGARLAGKVAWWLG
jgi:hypothetical protein